MARDDFMCGLVMKTCEIYQLGLIAKKLFILEEAVKMQRIRTSKTEVVVGWS